MLKGKTIVVGVSGGIAAYKTCELVSRLRKQHAEVHVIMTKNATQFVAPLTFETLSNHPVVTDTFARPETWEVEHVALAKKADLFIIAPATANCIAKFAIGLADDMLSTTVLATKAKVLLAPAMNTGMYTNEAFEKNLQMLKDRGFFVLEGASGFLACGDEGKGRMAEAVDIAKKAEELLFPVRDYASKRVLITAGATLERLDPVRYISNFSSGKMGIELAKNARDRGAEVTLVLGKHSVPVPEGVRIRNVETTQDMYRAVMEEMSCQDVVIKAAAPCDYKPQEISKEKIKSAELQVSFVKNPDIAAAVGAQKGKGYLVVFAAETQNLKEFATRKLHDKNADLMVANDVTKPGAGFAVDTNAVTIIHKDGSMRETDLLPKSEIAKLILDEVLADLNK